MDHNIPYQIQQLIDSMLYKKDNVHLRGNYRFRLDYIRGAIDTAIRKYDKEVLASDASRAKRKKA